MYFLTIEITRRRFASTIFVRASCPLRRMVIISPNVERNSSGGMPNVASAFSSFARTSASSASRFFDFGIASSSALRLICDR